MRAAGDKLFRYGSRLSVAMGFSLCASFLGALAHGQQSSVGGQVEVIRRNAAKPASTSANASDASNVVVWLTPADGSAVTTSAASLAQRHPQLVQHNKSFEPHVLVIQVGSTVQFPNKDPFFHNVFSLFDGKRFDLGLYEGGSTNSARFDRVGISFLFCNIHPEMNAIVVAVATPYFAVSDHGGRVAIPAVPDGQYVLHVWYERSSPEELKSLERPVTVSGSAHSLPAIQVTDNGDYKLAHKNKYGQDYVSPSGPAYNHP
jgi:plastocyanin